MIDFSFVQSDAVGGLCSAELVEMVNMDNILYPGIGDLIVILMRCNYTVNISKNLLRNCFLDRISQMMKILEVFEAATQRVWVVLSLSLSRPHFSLLDYQKQSILFSANASLCTVSRSVLEYDILWFEAVWAEDWWKEGQDAGVQTCSQVIFASRSQVSSLWWL